MFKKNEQHPAAPSTIAALSGTATSTTMSARRCRGNFLSGKSLAPRDWVTLLVMSGLLLESVRWMDL